MARNGLDDWALASHRLPSPPHESLPSLIEKLPVAAYTCDPDGLITYFNPAALRLWGRAPKLRDEADRFCGSFRLYLPDGTPIPHERCWMARALDSGRDFTGCEILVERPDGRRRNVLAHAIPVRTASGEIAGALNVLVDITDRKRAEDERRRLEERMRHAQRLESLGVLAGGVAHAFNNLLTPVLGYARIAAGELGRDSRAQHMLAEIATAAGRAAELTRQLQAYSGQSGTVVADVSLDDVVRDMKALLEAVVATSTRLELSLAPAMVRADATQLRQIAMNLITNASEALAGAPGTIAVRTGTRVMDAAALRSPYLRQELAPGRYAYLEVADSGVGMGPALLGRLFDPFVTTRATAPPDGQHPAPGAAGSGAAVDAVDTSAAVASQAAVASGGVTTGRGLGLTAVLGIVRAHGGTVQVTSAPDEGTTFAVFLPCAATPAAHEEPAGGIVAPVDAGTVLVVDDDDEVRSLIAAVLDTAGFGVLPAAGGGDALGVFAQHRDEVAAAVIDLALPDIGGWEVAAHLQEQRVDLPVLMMSGHAVVRRPHGYGNVRLAGVVAKPFDPDDLVDRIGRAVAAAAPAEADEGSAGS